MRPSPADATAPKMSFIISREQSDGLDLEPDGLCLRPSYKHDENRTAGALLLFSLKSPSDKLFLRRTGCVPIQASWLEPVGLAYQPAANGKQYICPVTFDNPYSYRLLSVLPPSAYTI